MGLRYGCLHGKMETVPVWEYCPCGYETSGEYHLYCPDCGDRFPTSYITSTLVIGDVEGSD